MLSFVDRRLARLRAAGKTECGFRVIEGQQPGLGSRWSHGVAELLPGLVRYRPGMGGGIRLARPGQAWLTLEVVEASRATERTAGMKESWSVSDSARILLVRTPTALLEWAVVPNHRDWALNRAQSKRG
jgi:hypothetical protein